MVGSDHKPVVLKAYAKAIPELQTAIEAAEGDIFEVDLAQVRHRWFMRLSLAERFAIKRYETATAPTELESIAPEAIAFLRRLGCKIDQNQSLQP